MATKTPRNVRPSWCSLKVDNQEKAASGPKARSGELVADFFVRHKGEAVPCLSVEMIADKSGHSVLVRINASFPNKQSGAERHEPTTIYETRIMQ